MVTEIFHIVFAEILGLFQDPGLNYLECACTYRLGPTYHISLNGMRGLYSFHCFNSARIIKGTLCFLNVKSYTEISAMKFQTGNSNG